jgi:SPP1 family predicted phage head-tail adaptor
MRAGDYNKRITFQESTHARNDFNEMVTTYADCLAVWAAIEWQGGRRYMEAKQLNAEVQGVVRIRWRDGIKPEWRVKYKGRYFEIISIANVYERSRELQISVKEAQD